MGRARRQPRPRGRRTRRDDELVAGVERGVLVTDFWYTRILDPRTQVVTGLTRNGVWLIEDGRDRPAGHEPALHAVVPRGARPGRGPRRSARSGRCSRRLGRDLPGPEPPPGELELHGRREGLMTELDFGAFDALTFRLLRHADRLGGRAPRGAPASLAAHGVDAAGRRAPRVVRRGRGAAESGPYLPYRTSSRAGCAASRRRSASSRRRPRSRRVRGSVGRLAGLPRLGGGARAPPDRASGSASSRTATTTCSRRRTAASGVEFDWVVTAQQVGSYKPNDAQLRARVRAHRPAARADPPRRPEPVPRPRAGQAARAARPSGSTGATTGPARGDATGRRASRTRRSRTWPRSPRPPCRRADAPAPPSSAFARPPDLVGVVVRMRGVDPDPPLDAVRPRLRVRPGA